MAEYWKSTPSYWCKFCHTYVRDTGIERKNHEASGKHQNNIQRSLRDLHKGKEREEREKQRAKDEVARLNGLVDGGKKSNSGVGSGGGGGKILGATPTTASAPAKIDVAAQRKAHAEQLAALGVELPDVLKKEVTGVGGWQMVSTHVVEDSAGERSLADIIKQEREEESKGDVKSVVKRKMAEEEAAPRIQAAWGSRKRIYPGHDRDERDDGDLDALLSGVGKKKALEIKAEDISEVKKEESPPESKPLAAVPDINAPTAVKVKQEGSEDAPPPVVFKKRKVKK